MDSYSKKIEIIQRYYPEIIGEIGVFKGDCAKTFLNACPGAFYYGIDIFSRVSIEEVEDAFRVEFPNRKVFFYKIDSMSVSRLPRKDIGFKKKYDFIHIDGLHKRYYVYNDLVVSLASLRKGGIILCDDYNLFEVRLGIRDFLKSYGQFIKKHWHESSPHGEYLLEKK